MANMSMEDLLKQCGSTYKLVILAARRAKELVEGAQPLIPSEKNRKITTIALEEIRTGKVHYELELEDGGSGKSKSRAKASVKKRVAA